MVDKSNGHRKLPEHSKQVWPTESSRFEPEMLEIIEVAPQSCSRQSPHSNVRDTIAAFVCGFALCYGVVAMSITRAALGGDDGTLKIVAGGLAFPLGLIFMLRDTAGLLARNFFLSVSTLYLHSIAFHRLGQRWGIALICNLAGSALFAVLIAWGQVFDEPVAEELHGLAEEHVQDPGLSVFVNAIFGGWLIAIMTWLLPKAPSVGVRLVLIYFIGFVLQSARFNHVAVASAEVFLAIAMGAPLALASWLSHVLLPATLGNIIGGGSVVFLLRNRNHGRIGRAA